MSDLVKGNWIELSTRMWKVEDVTRKYMRLRLATWHKEHEHQAGEKVDIEGEEWTVTGTYSKTMHLRREA